MVVVIMVNTFKFYLAMPVRGTAFTIPKINVQQDMLMDAMAVCQRIPDTQLGKGNEIFILVFIGPVMLPVEINRMRRRGFVYYVRSLKNRI